MGASLEEYIPIIVTILKAIAIGLVGFGIASLLKSGTVKLLSKIKYLEDEQEFVQNLSKLVYYFILLVTIIAVLEILGLKYITQPFIDLLNEVTSYIPNIIGAGIILFVGILLSKIAKDFIKSLLTTLKVDDFAKKYNIDNLSGLIANLVYLILVLFVIMASLNALNITVISKPATEMISSILIAIPRIIAASIVFGIIFFVGKLVAEIVAKVVDDINLDEIANKIGLSSTKVTFPNLVKYTIMTFATLIGLSQAFDYIEANSLYNLTQEFIEILFKVLVAAGLVMAAMYIGSQLEEKMANKTLGRITRIALTVMATLLILPFIGISPEIITTLVLSISLGIGLAFALAFGLGGKDVAKRFLEDLLFKNKETKLPEVEANKSTDNPQNTTNQNNTV